MGNIVPGSMKTSTAKKGGRADIGSLLLHTEHHPKGRITIDPTTGMVVNPKNNTLFKKTLAVKVEGQVVGSREIAVNGGHAKKDNSVWRIALRGPSRYQQMVNADNYRAVYQGRNDRTATSLTPEEFEEYQYFQTFLIEEKLKVPVTKDDQQAFDDLDASFYEWLSSQDKAKIAIQPPVPLHPNAPQSAPVM